MLEVPRENQQADDLREQEHGRQYPTLLEQVAEQMKTKKKPMRKTESMKETSRREISERETSATASLNRLPVKETSRRELPVKETRATVTLKPLPGYVSVREAAKLLGVSERSVYGYIEAGKLPGVRIGPFIAVESQALEHYERRAPGRVRVRTPDWHIPPSKNQLSLTRISVQMRRGQRERLEHLLAQMRLADRHRIHGTVARYITGPHAQTNEVEIILVWRAASCPLLTNVSTLSRRLRPISPRCSTGRPPS
jgi:excisionase family DNA binding protein